jgi:tRNA (guanine37-N1)-methyltransferase
VDRWRRRESLRITRERRPELFARLELDEEDRRLIEAGDDEL